jgi:hypothetical protein
MELVMNDNEIKRLLDEDRSVPEAPVNEWNQIHSKIRTKHESIFSFFKMQSTIAIACGVLIVLTIIRFNSQALVTESQRDELTDFILEDSYLAESQDLYSWIE